MAKIMQIHKISPRDPDLPNEASRLKPPYREFALHVALPNGSHSPSESSNRPQSHPLNQNSARRQAKHHPFRHPRRREHRRPRQLPLKPIRHHHTSCPDLQKTSDVLHDVDALGFCDDSVGAASPHFQGPRQYPCLYLARIIK